MDAVRNIFLHFLPEVVGLNLMGHDLHHPLAVLLVLGVQDLKGLVKHLLQNRHSSQLSMVFMFNALNVNTYFT